MSTASLPIGTGASYKYAHFQSPTTFDENYYTGSGGGSTSSGSGGATGSGAGGSTSSAGTGATGSGAGGSTSSAGTGATGNMSANATQTYANWFLNSAVENRPVYLGCFYIMKIK